MTDKPPTNGGRPAGADRSLSVIAPRAIRRSRMSRRRALVFIGIHVLFAIHLAHWYAAGKTLTPVEPAEAMQFSKNGVVNAGVIFFALSMLSTLVFGRFFCGWSCHLAALQDLCRWLLGRVGIRPRLMRSRLLLFVPTVAFFYMFVFPLVQRFGAGQSLAPTTAHFTTAQFWATFPGWFVGALTFLMCGFVAVYLLGSKGFCTYACPYGGMFAPLDRWSVGRIVVSDACDGRGHCTAVCTSNVRVHEEVRDFGMVVDPGCMKCMDCVSVCPNDALSFSFGKPAALAARRTAPSTVRAPLHRDIASWVRAHRRAIIDSAIYAACFMAASWVLFGSAYSAIPVWVWALLSAWLGHSAARLKSEYSLAEELLLAVMFLLGMAAFRGLYGAVPFLMSLGVGAILAYLGLLTVRLLSRPNVRLQQWTLRRGGALTRTGCAFLAIMLCVTGVWAHAGMIQACDAYAADAYRQTLALAPSLESAVAAPVALDDENRRLVERGAAVARWLERTVWVASGANEIRLTWFQLLLGDAEKAEAHLNEALKLQPTNVDLRWDAARFMSARGKPEEALSLLRSAVDADPARPEARLRLAQTLATSGRLSDAEDVLARAETDLPAAADVRHAHAVLMLTMNRVDAAVDKLREALRLDPNFAPSHHLLGEVYCASGRLSDGVEELRQGARLSPRDARVRVRLGLALCELGQLDEALRALNEAAELAPSDPQPQRALSRCFALRGEPEESNRRLSRASELERASRPLPTTKAPLQPEP